jgi:hypothetical protein
LGRIVAQLEEHGIEVILLKGAALAPALYEDLGTRPMSDLDLLARQEEIDRASGVLQQLGYREHYPPQLGMPRGVNQAIAHERHLRGGPGGELAIELHWNIIAGAGDRRAPPPQWPWDERIPFESAHIRDQAGKPLRSWSLSPTASLLYAAAHLMLQHGSQARLLWNYDLHLILTHSGEAIRWAELPLIAGELHWADALSLALQDTQARFATPLPEGVIESLAHYSDPAARRIIALRAAEEDELKAIMLLSPQVYSLPTRIRLALAAAFPSPAYMRWRYRPRPSWAWPLYYFVRAAKIARYRFKSVRIAEPMK